MLPACQIITSVKLWKAKQQCKLILMQISKKLTNTGIWYHEQTNTVKYSLAWTHTHCHTPTRQHSRPGYISVISKACQRKREKISSGIQFAHSVNKPTDAAAGQSVGNILKAQPVFYSKKRERNWICSWQTRVSRKWCSLIKMFIDSSWHYLLIAAAQV